MELISFKRSGFRLDRITPTRRRRRRPGRSSLSLCTSIVALSTCKGKFAMKRAQIRVCSNDRDLRSPPPPPPSPPSRPPLNEATCTVFLPPTPQLTHEQQLYPCVCSVPNALAWPKHTHFMWASLLRPRQCNFCPANDIASGCCCCCVVSCGHSTYNNSSKQVWLRVKQQQQQPQQWQQMAVFNPPKDRARRRRRRTSRKVFYKRSLLQKNGAV